MGKITVTFQTENYPSDKDFTLCCDFASRMFDRELSMVDTPTNVGAVFFCTPQSTREDIYKRRAEMAKMLAEMICDGLKSKDLIDGYKQKV